MKVIGPFVLFVGIAGLAFSMYDFITLEFFEEPKYFWVGFVSMPIIFVGFILTGVAYRKKMMQLNEEILRDQMRVVGQGLREGLSDSGKFCSNCGHSIIQDSKFCSECGKSILG